MPHTTSTTKRTGTESHSSHSDERSRRYHAEVIEATKIDRGATKMTRQAATRGKQEEMWAK